MLTSTMRAPPRSRWPQRTRLLTSGKSTEKSNNITASSTSDVGEHKRTTQQHPDAGRCEHVTTCALLVPSFRVVPHEYWRSGGCSWRASLHGERRSQGCSGAACLRREAPTSDMRALPALSRARLSGYVHRAAFNHQRRGVLTLSRWPDGRA